MKELSEIVASPEISDILPVEPLTTTLVWANLVLPLHTRKRLGALPLDTGGIDAQGGIPYRVTSNR